MVVFHIFLSRKVSHSMSERSYNLFAAFVGGVHLYLSREQIQVSSSFLIILSNEGHFVIHLSWGDVVPASIDEVVLDSLLVSFSRTSRPVAVPELNYFVKKYEFFFYKF